MFKDWKKNKIQNEKYFQGIKEQLDKLEPSYLKNIISTNYEIELILNGHHNNPTENYEEIISKLINNKFWEDENLEFKKITNKELGKKAIAIWELLKPFYRENAAKPENYDATWINLSKEINQELIENNEQYRITPSSRFSRQDNDILDPEEECIEIYNPIEKILEISNKESKPDNIHSIKATSQYFRNVSLQELYEEIIEKLTPKQFHEYANGKDKLEHILILYIIKRAKNQDPFAEKLLFDCYNKKAEDEAYKFIKNFEIEKNIVFKKDSDFGKENIKYVSAIFLRMLISGDDPDSFFELINFLDSGSNLDIIFTRKLGAKVREQINKTNIEIADTVQKIKDIGESIIEIELKSTEIMRSISEKDYDSVIKRINNAMDEVEKPHLYSRISYRKFININKFSNYMNELYNEYMEAEDFTNDPTYKYLPDLFNSHQFERFDTDLKNELEKIIKEAKDKEKCKINNLPNAYRTFIDISELNDSERIIYDIFEEVDNFVKRDCIPRIDKHFASLIGLSNPFFWISTGDWFNNKAFDATINNNFTNWLFKDSGNKPGAFKAMMILWINSSEFKSDGEFKGEFIEIDKKYNDFEKIASSESPILMEDLNSSNNLNSLSYEEKDLIEKLISKYISQTSGPEFKKKRNTEILQDFLIKKMNDDKIDYRDLGKKFRVSKTTIFNICNKFETFSKKELKR